MPFQKGQSGNPKGRPKKGMSWSDVLKEMADEEIEGDANVKTKMQIIASRLWKKANEGDLKAIEMLMDRIDGKAKQSVDHTTNGESMNLTISFVKSDEE